jgi:hypothetical protein
MTDGHSEAGRFAERSFGIRATMGAKTVYFRRTSPYPLTIVGGAVNAGWLGAAGAEEIVRPRRLIGHFQAAPQLHR